MKKWMSLLLSLLAVLSLAACSSESKSAEEIDALLQGKWSYETDDATYNYYFDEDRVMGSTVSCGLETPGQVGSYQITDETIEIYYGEEKAGEFTYTCKGDRLQLFLSGDEEQEFEKN